MKKLFIDVKGENNTGKTTITYLIKEFLKKEGFKVDLNFSEEHCSKKDFDEDATLHLHNKTKVLKEQVKIIISEKNILRNIRKD